VEGKIAFSPCGRNRLFLIETISGRGREGWKERTASNPAMKKKKPILSAEKKGRKDKAAVFTLSKQKGKGKKGRLKNSEKRG